MLSLSRSRWPSFDALFHHNAFNKLTALTRYAKTKELYPVQSSRATLLDVSVVAGLGIFLLLLMFAPGLYYWPSTSWQFSPPLATRSGWAGLALTPVLFILPAKKNWISLVTGVSHERLNIYHRWFAYYLLVVALLHTFPFIYFDIQMGMMEMEWATDAFVWTGVIALLAQAWLTFASCKPIRRQYEFFKFFHRLMAAVFFVFFFLHCANTQTSWNYFYAIFAFYGASVLYRLASMIWINTLSNYMADIEVVSAHVLRIRITGNSPNEVNWSPGQHIYLRFLCDIPTSLFAHPLTITNASLSDLPFNEKTSRGWELIFYAKVFKGTTARLASRANGRSFTTRVWLDGPYGEAIQIEKNSDVLILTGGSGE